MVNPLFVTKNASISSHEVVQKSSSHRSAVRALYSGIRLSVSTVPRPKCTKTRSNKSRSGRILHSTANPSRKDEDTPIKSGPIRCSGISRDGRYLGTSGDDKRLMIWDVESLVLLGTRELPKKPTSIEFSGDSDILVSDKFGDVFRYSFHPIKEPAEENAAGNAPAARETLSSGELILGHASLLTSFLLTQDDKFIITADRDEHIRVSWYPQGYAIESYCLGHKKYVSAIHIPAESPTMLISGGGDPELKVWDWLTGCLQQNITVFPVVEPFIKVTGGKTNSGITTSGTVFVVRRIGSFLSGGENHVVFCVVGATAIFEFVLGEAHNDIDIRYYDFGKPVIDFTISEEGTIFVLIDADFAEESDSGDDHPRGLVQAIQWSTDKFVDAGTSPLLDSLNTICSLPATAEDLQAVDLYSDLSSLPKSFDEEQGSREHGRPVSMHVLEEDNPASGGSVPVGLTKRALGRLKHKRALDQLRHEDTDVILVPETKKMKANSDDEELPTA